MNFLLDTDTCSAYLKGNRRIWSPFQQYAGVLAISAVTAGELWTWAKRAKASRRASPSVEQFLHNIACLSVDATIAQRFGELRARLLDLGTPVPDMDLLIAATAISHNLTLVTHNTADYAGIPGLRFVDWLAP